MQDRLEPVSWGVLSTADIGLEKVLPAMQDSELSRVDAIASRSKEKADEAAESLRIGTTFGSYEELLADPSIEAVYIPLPNHLHLQWTLAAAEAGKHVLCEKPIAMNSDDARLMVQACESAGVLLMEAFMYRLHPMWLKVVELIETGAIGELRSVQTAFSYFNDDPHNIRNIPEVGGGSLYDIGCYAVNAARLLFGSEPTGVKSVVLRDPELGTDILTSALLDFGGGHSSFVCSTQMEDDQRVVVHGTTGRIVVEIPFNIPPDRPTRVLEISGGDPPVDPDVEVHEIPAANPYSVEADAFSTAIRTGAAAPIPPEDAVANMEAIERIFADASG
jgi:predicted dehydrogenase